MGYETERFVGEPVDTELICAICRGVLENPTQLKFCEHIFCNNCILTWLMTKRTCPICRTFISYVNLLTPPRLLKVLLSRLTIKCEFAEHGCTEILSLDAIKDHVEKCEYDPKRLVKCVNCHLALPREFLKKHSCTYELRGMMAELREKLDHFKSDVAQRNKEISEVYNELQDLKVFLSEMHYTVLPEPLLHLSIFQSAQMRSEELEMKWMISLPWATIVWENLIPQPDKTICSLLKEELIETKCPKRLLEALVQNSNERSWPLGLRTKESRAINEGIMRKFILRCIGNIHAVVLLNWDNPHLSSDCICEPGLVMLFANGVEIRKGYECPNITD